MGSCDFLHPPTFDMRRYEIIKLVGGVIIRSLPQRRWCCGEYLRQGWEADAERIGAEPLDTESHAWLSFSLVRTTTCNSGSDHPVAIVPHHSEASMNRVSPVWLVVGRSMRKQARADRCRWREMKAMSLEAVSKTRSRVRSMHSAGASPRWASASFQLVETV